LRQNTSTSGITPAREFDGQGSRHARYGVERNPLNEPININALVDLLFSELNLWTFIVYGNKRESNHRNYDVCGGYIVLTVSVSTLRNQLQRVSKSSCWNPRARFVVAFLNSFYDPPLMAQWLLEELWKHKILNVVVLVPNEEGERIPVLNVYTWYPYQSTGQCTEVKDVTLIDTWVMKGNGYFMRNTYLFPQKISKNLHGCPLRISTQPTIFAVEGFDVESLARSNETKVMYKDGWEIKLLRIITKKMNMIEHYLYPLRDFLNATDNEGNSIGYTGELLNDTADVAVGLLVMRKPRRGLVATRPHHWGRLSWYVPCGSRYPRWMSIFRMFSGSVWALLIVSVVLSVPVITFIARFSDDSLYNTQSNTLFSTLASILSVSVPAMPRTWPLRCFFISWVCYSLAVDTVFQTYLTSFLIDPGIIPHPRNLEELARSDMKLGINVADQGFYQDRTDAEARQIMAKKVECVNQRACYMSAKKYKNLAILLPELVYKFLRSENQTYETSSNFLCQIEDGVVEYGPVVMFLPKGSSLLSRINDIIYHVVEAGILDEWVKMSNHIQMVKEKASLPGGLSDEYYKLSLEHLQSAFYLLLLGYCISFVIFVTEHICKSALFY
jgi:hypothetical protein